MKKEKRDNIRFDTEVRIYFNVDYELETKVEFQVINKKNDSLSEKHIAYSRNISAEGLCFTSEVKLHETDNLNLEVYLPDSDTPIPMKGEVKWCKKSGTAQCETGVIIKMVNNKSVKDSIIFDQVYKIKWSEVLNAIFGNFEKFVQDKKKSD